jgi:putative hydrolase of the HAD superfamily
MVKVIFFDSVNVLIEGGFASGIESYEKANSMKKSSLYEAMHDFPYWKEFTLGNITEENYFSQVARHLDGELDLKQLKKAILDNFIPNVELIEYIKKLKRKYKVGIISNSPKEWFEYFYRKFDWDAIFDVIAVSGYVHIRKPDREIFKHALGLANVSGSEAIYIDDRPERTEGAESLGMKIIIYREVAELISKVDSALANKK